MLNELWPLIGIIIGSAIAITIVVMGYLSKVDKRLDIMIAYQKAQSKQLHEQSHTLRDLRDALQSNSKEHMKTQHQLERIEDELEEIVRKE